MVELQTYGSLAGLRMLGNIGDRFQNDAVSSDLDGGWQVRCILLGFKGDFKIPWQLK